MDGVIINKVKWKSHSIYGNSIYCIMFIFSNRMNGAIIDETPIKLMKIPLWQISWHVVPGLQVRRLIRLSTWFAAWCTWSPGFSFDAWFPAISPALDNNLKNCHKTIIKLMVKSCIALFKINMHELFILLLTLFLIYLIYFLIKTPLIYLIYIIIIIFFLNVLDFAYYMLH